jgi:hypothetical protein
MHPSLHRVLHSALVLAACLCGAGPAHAQPTDATALSGLWRGTYVCIQGETALELDLRGNAYGIVRGTFAFSATGRNRDVPSGVYPVLGRLSRTSLVLRPVDAPELPQNYVPVGIQATVAPGATRITGWIEGPVCGEVMVERMSQAASADPLPGGYGGHEWEIVDKSAEGTLYVDARARPGEGSTARVWTRWHTAVSLPQTGLRAGQAMEAELEFDCGARLMRVWRTIVYTADGEMQHVDALAPYGWQPVVAGTTDEPVFDRACGGAR